MKKALTSKERVLTAFARQQPDRVPINYMANRAIDHRLKVHLGLQEGDHEGLRQALGVDFRGVGTPHIGPKLHAGDAERGITASLCGERRIWSPHGSGGYWEIYDYPLIEADEEAVANWPLPTPDDFDYSQLAQACKDCGAYAVTVHCGMLPDVINSGAYLRGMEQTMIDFITDDPAGLLLIKRRTDIQLEILTRALEAAKGGVDFIWLAEDLGTQRGPLISKEVFRKHIRSIHQRFIDVAKAHGLPVMLHSCGSSSWAYDDLIEMGVNVVDTLQPEATDMAPAYLKEKFADRVAFHGCISTAGPVAYGTVDDVIRDCREKLDIMMPGGGYSFAPTHSLQDNSPTENVLAMYETARVDGVYR